LGLAVCRRIIVERHHGKIHVESEENKGTTVKVELPAGQRSGK
jgi:signal transduction histidine kinase